MEPKAVWSLDYTDEAKYYFVDNGDFVFDLLVQIEVLKFSESGIPLEDCTQIEANIFLWKVLGHYVIYERNVNLRRIRIAVVKYSFLNA